ncbi:TetR family transcriptional regulator [Curtobacterium sp. MMLR14_010]|uniref:TetR/AcrR family transcriptional regulator n=1 Tax=Curtobacterium sp. MMLR14_010 TaxID=1898743 RepID=UPI0008DE14AD|nr:TetR/AcrR family transcriptional regulator [Curtobacterium sp. MMLR14_010]OII34989.1 TetR family transcriptional regulator [Curtobacterium sp. MMLR14_010]
MAMRAGTERKLLDAAEELFFARGIAATSVDAVLERAGVSSATLYRGWPSKEALVAATLTRRQQDWEDTWTRAVEAATTPRGRVLAVFDALDAFRTRSDASRWCAFLGTASEYADAPAEIRAVLDVESDVLRSRLTALAEEVVGHTAPTVGEQLTLVVSGSLAMRLRDPGYDTTVARAVAGTLLDAADR